jgi:hypothetical protein
LCDTWNDKYSSSKELLSGLKIYSVLHVSINYSIFESYILYFFMLFLCQKIVKINVINQKKKSLFGTAIYFARWSNDRHRKVVAEVARGISVNRKRVNHVYSRKENTRNDPSYDSIYYIYIICVHANWLYIKINYLRMNFLFLM